MAPSLARATSASQGRRIALVIGNSAYRNVVRLNNPQNDARAIGASLENIGFDRITIVTRDKLREALKTFADDARNADWAMICYAGHGVDLRSVDYLIPIDAKIATESDAISQGVPLAEVTAAIEGARKLKLVMLDACRDNPFEAQAAAPAASIVWPRPGDRPPVRAR